MQGKWPLRKCIAIAMSLIVLFSITFLQGPIVKELRVNATDTSTSAPTEGEGGDATEEESKPSVADSQLEVTFFEMGDGDCTFVQIGNTEILIDTGDLKKSGKFEGVKNQLLTRIQDKKLEYLFVTHGDSDHLGNLPTLFKCFTENKYGIDNIIDFDSEYKKDVYKTNAYDNYVEERDKFIKGNENAHRDIASFWEKGGASPVVIDLEGDLKLHLLYNQWYFDAKKDSKYCNVSSICIMLEYGESKVLLTGDLEEVDTTANPEFFGGESQLMENNGKELFYKTTLFKAGHHGSRSSNSKAFIDVVKPQYVMITCEAGGSNHFPSQEALDNLLCYTDKIFISSYHVDGGVMATYHGDVTFFLDQEENVRVECTNADNGESGRQNLYGSNGEFNPIMETRWFKENRSATLHTYVFSGCESENNAYMGNCTLLKYGSQEVLIDCGVRGTVGRKPLQTTCFIDKIDEYCVDGKLEYVIVSTPDLDSIQQLADCYIDNKIHHEGILSLYEIGTLIDFGDVPSPVDEGVTRCVYNRYNQTLENNEIQPLDAATCSIDETDFCVAEGFSFRILKNETYGQEDSSVCCKVMFFGQGLLFTGKLEDVAESYVVANNDLLDVVFFKVGYYGYSGANTDVLIDALSPTLFIAVNTTAGEEFSCFQTMTVDVCERFIWNSRKAYMTTVKEGDKYQEYCGDILFYVTQSNGRVSNMDMVGSVNNQDLMSYYATL